eukprot:gene57173-78342_t
MDDVAVTCLRCPVLGHIPPSHLKTLFSGFSKIIFQPLCGLTVVGTIGYVVIDDYPWLDSLYMTIITIGTVGYGEIHPLSSGGRIFTIMLIISSVGLVAYYLTIVTRLLADGEWARE